MKDDLSHVVSHALRHEPWLYELELDPEGWIELELLAEALRTRPGFAGVQPADIEQMVSDSVKKRHEILQGRIRAAYGHSFTAKVPREPTAPPAELFHGTSPGAAHRIVSGEGLNPMGRQYVHLSADLGTAQAVGLRKSPTPVILTVDAHQAHLHGIHFYLAGPKIWLTDHVPADFIT